MSFLSWLRNQTSIRSSRGRAQDRPRAARFRPQLEALEDRWLPSTLTVANNLGKVTQVPSTLTVTSLADSGPGSLRAEIAAASSNDTIVFAPSLDGQTITLTSGGLVINKSLTIQGPGADQLTISGGGVSGVFSVQFALQQTTKHAQPQTINVTISGLTISNGAAAGSTGGAITNGMGDTLTLSGCILSGNSALEGGAIANWGTMMVTGCTLSGNHADLYGGAIYNLYGTMTVSNCTFSANTAYDPHGPSDTGEGGAIYTYDPNATLTISGSTLSDNSAGYLGGAIYIYDTIHTVTLSNYGSNNVFSNNSPDTVYIGSAR
jgi:hypothetical protein